MDLNLLKGDKNMIKFDGDQNSSRPQFYYDSVSIFFFIVLYPCHSSASSSKLDKYYNLGDLKAGGGIDEDNESDRLSSDKPSKLQVSQVARLRNVVHIPAQIEKVGEDALPSEVAMKNHLLNAKPLTAAMSDHLFFFSNLDDSKGFGKPLRSMQQAPNSSEEEKNKKKALTVPKKLKSEKFERLEAFSEQLRRCFLKRVNHQTLFFMTAVVQHVYICNCVRLTLNVIPYTLCTKLIGIDSLSDFWVHCAQASS
ncbi:hypothetical protein GH714_027453 [Hevea brasiliensis]|uniref:Uncharacterized protein n=1 Tax=Hevea brasiliensis TaxID=3981 RepID=A0A6A6ME10_HEVBR|nr:hypothetical protein GH714_027453 [Hevea brasiliensis]